MNPATFPGAVSPGGSVRLPSEAKETLLLAETADTPQVLALVGDLCIAEAPEVRRRIDDLIALGARDLTIDLAEATLLTAAGLRVFAAAEARLEGLGGCLRLRNPPPLPLRVLQITGFDRLLEPAMAG